MVKSKGAASVSTLRPPIARSPDDIDPLLWRARQARGGAREQRPQPSEWLTRRAEAPDSARRRRWDLGARPGRTPVEAAARAGAACALRRAMTRVAQTTAIREWGPSPLRPRESLAESPAPGCFRPGTQIPPNRSQQRSRSRDLIPHRLTADEFSRTIARGKRSSKSVSGSRGETGAAYPAPGRYTVPKRRPRTLSFPSHVARQSVHPGSVAPKPFSGMG